MVDVSSVLISEVGCYGKGPNLGDLMLWERDLEECPL